MTSREYADIGRGYDHGHVDNTMLTLAGQSGHDACGVTSRDYADIGRADRA